MKKKWIIALVVFLALIIILGIVEFNKEETIEVIAENNVSSSVIENKDTLSNKEKKELAADTVTKCIDLVDYDTVYQNAMPNILEELGFASRDNIQKMLESTTPNEKGYFKTGVKYDDFKRKMLEVFTEEYFNIHFDGYPNIDGYVGVVNTGIGLPACSLDSIISVEYQGENKYLCEAKIRDDEVYWHYENPEEGEIISLDDCFFTWNLMLRNVGGKLLLDEIIYDEN